MALRSRRAQPPVRQCPPCRCRVLPGSPACTSSCSGYCRCLNRNWQPCAEHWRRRTSWTTAVVDQDTVAAQRGSNGLTPQHQAGIKPRNRPETGQGRAHHLGPARALLEAVAQFVRRLADRQVLLHVAALPLALLQLHAQRIVLRQRVLRATSPPALNAPPRVRKLVPADSQSNS